MTDRVKEEQKSRSIVTLRQAHPSAGSGGHVVDMVSLSW